MVAHTLISQTDSTKPNRIALQRTLVILDFDRPHKQ